MRNKLIKAIGFFTVVFTSSNVLAEVAVIVHPSNTSQLNTESIKRIFLGKDVLFPDGSKIAPMAMESGPIADEFNQKVLERNSSQLKAYWSKLVFTGKGVPPEYVTSDADMVKAVAGAANKIGFVNSASVDDSVKVIATF
ncbi:phosphate ABC transporter substrate-binding protein [Alteromonas sp. a30]|uniref:phosphate ABC transporter substrate-binding protein n=1 Tax=Alteromonas sp. a30 TaxID=2730917 RepID=UPI0022806881|nr:phosphate ABC transporter substrate-binding protein [Alteromonas sp. a30]MCY7295922.1 phosphate ABC transporter substrate-binding protein [Alteromonas sp. a30]